LSSRDPNQISPEVPPIELVVDGHVADHAPRQQAGDLHDDDNLGAARGADSHAGALVVLAGRDRSVELNRSGRRCTGFTSPLTGPHYT